MSTKAKVKMKMRRIKICARFPRHFFPHGIKLHYEIPDIVHIALKLYLFGALIVEAIKCDGFPVGITLGRINLGNDRGVIEINTRCSETLQ